MRKSILFAAICGLMSSVAFAESPAPWPREPHPGDFGSARALKSAPVTPSWTADSQSYDAWKALPAAHDAGGQHPTSQAELDAQRRAHQNYRIIRHSQIVEAGFCNAPMLPPEYAAFCWGAKNGANPTGGAIGSGDN